MRIVLLIGVAALAAAADKKPVEAKSPLDRYVNEAYGRAALKPPPAMGSIWMPGAGLADTARDLKASQVDDLVTILVVERASAVARGATKSARSSNAEYSILAAGGLTKAAGPWANLLSGSGSQSLDGEGTTTRETTLSTTLTARVVGVMPNGYLVLEGTKALAVNSESQVVIVRGVARPFDVGPGNLVRSDRLAQLEVRINGKGVVGDAVRRPNFLYRLLLGILPF